MRPQRILHIAAYLALLLTPKLYSLQTQPSQEEAVDDSVIPHASYMVYEGKEEIIGSIPMNSRYVTFYTADGDAVDTIKHHRCFSAMQRKLDASAPKPRPVACAIKYWPAYEIGFGLTKGVPGDFIVFYDKHHNTIKAFRHDINQRIIEALEDFNAELDITNITREVLIAIKTQSTESIKAQKTSFWKVFWKLFSVVLH